MIAKLYTDTALWLAEPGDGGIDRPNQASRPGQGLPC